MINRITNIHKMLRIVIPIIFSLLPSLSLTKCAFQVGTDGVPLRTDRQPFLIQGMTQCAEYNGQIGCCDSGNDVQQSTSYVEIDGVFGSLGDGCDICAINLKRFWCEYACSPNQADFMDVKEGLWPIPNPQKPDQTLMVQKLDLRVHSDTACDLFNSCKRISFVSSVSAMSTPAGFLTFQGHNAANDALQDMSISFSYNTSNSVYFSTESRTESGKPLQVCNLTVNNDTLHGFAFNKNCTCNNCESACKNDQGFIYSDPSILEGFNPLLVGGVWAFSIFVAVIASRFRGGGSDGRVESSVGKTE